MKSVLGDKEDLSSGVNVMITGSANPDGSMSAKTIQVRGSEVARPTNSPAQ